MPVQVAVCGPSDATPEEVAHAAEIGRLLAERGAIVICGGYGGVMGAVAEGAAEAGGLVVGILSGSDRTGASPHLSIALPTGLGEARNNLVAQAGDALIAVGGNAAGRCVHSSHRLSLRGLVHLLGRDESAIAVRVHPASDLMPFPAYRTSLRFLPRRNRYRLRHQPGQLFCGTCGLNLRA
jgi:uncharacterized protein (TIGR00725 family)